MVVEATVKGTISSTILITFEYKIQDRAILFEPFVLPRCTYCGVKRILNGRYTYRAPKISTMARVIL
jgi:hypothetical protein